MDESLIDVMTLALTIHRDSFVPDPGCEVTGEYRTTVRAATEEACRRFALPPHVAGPLGIVLEHAVEDAGGPENLIEEIAQAKAAAPPPEPEDDWSCPEVE